jgi:hypothetical protein
MEKEKLKEGPERFVKDASTVTGVSIKKALSVLIPPEILKESSFLGGFVRLGESMESYGTGKESEIPTGQDYIRKKTGGVAMDLSGVFVVGVPFTFATAVLSDGFKVASRVMEGAKTEDKNIEDASQFFGKMSEVSNNFMVLFDIPEKKSASKTRKSLEELIALLKKEERLTEPVLRDIKELENLAEKEYSDKKEWSDKVEKRIKDIVEREIQTYPQKKMRSEISHFIKEPSLENVSLLKNTLLKRLKDDDIKVREESEKYVNEFCSALESVSSKSFHDKVRERIIQHYETLGKTKDAADDASYYAFKMLYSVLQTTHKGISLFGKHYKDQLQGWLKEKTGSQSRSR